MKYFAYGSNMDVQQMAMRCPDATVIGVAKLPAHKFLINTHGVATVIPAKKHVVHGVLWEISKRDEASLDRCEGVASDFYRKAMVRVRVMGGNETDALIYFASDEQPGTPRLGYLERVVAAAKYHGLPPLTNRGENAELTEAEREYTLRSFRKCEVSWHVKRTT